MTRRCSICSLNWPDKEADFKQCPICLEETSKVSNVDAMPDDEARSLKAQADFERFYDQWDEDHDPLRLEGDAEPIVV